MGIKQKIIRLTKNLEGKFNWKLEDCITFLIVATKEILDKNQL